MPKIKLDDDVAANIVGTAQRIEYYDTSSKITLTLRVEGDHKVWGTRYRLGDRQPRYTIGPFPAISYDEAFFTACKVALAAREGRDPATERDERRAGAITVDQLAELYFEAAAPGSNTRYELAPKTFKVRRYTYRKHLVKPLGKRLVTDLRVNQIYSVLAGIAKSGVPAAANLCHSILRRICTFGVGTGNLEGNRNPMFAVTRPAVDKERDRILKPAEIKRIWEAAHAARDHVANGVILVALLTGQRTQEIRTMDLDEIEGRWWHLGGDEVDDVKNRLRHTVYLADPTWEIVKRASVDSKPSGGRFPRRPAFPGKKGNVPVSRKRVYEALDALRDELATAPYFCIHTFRHNLVTWCAGQPMEDRVQKALVNHKRKGSTARYEHARFREARQKWFTCYAEHIHRLVSGDEASVLTFPT